MAAKGCIAIKEDKKDQIAALKETFAGTPIEIRTVADRYPNGWERVLVYELTGKRYDRLPMEAGCILNNASTAIALGNALINGMPIIDKIITVSGNAVKNPQNIIVPIGTKASEVIDAVGGYVDGVDDVVLIAGGPMMGKAIPNDQFAICPQNNGLTVMKDEPKVEVPCLRCGRCTEVCPAGLEPVNIAGAAKRFDDLKLEKLNTMDCIECGLCTYICPSKIDVTENVRKGKRQLQIRLANEKKAKGGK